MKHWTITAEDRMGLNIGVEVDEDEGGSWVDAIEAACILAEKDRQLAEVEALIERSALLIEKWEDVDTMEDSRDWEAMARLLARDIRSRPKITTGDN